MLIPFKENPHGLPSLGWAMCGRVEELGRSRKDRTSTVAKLVHFGALLVATLSGLVTPMLSLHFFGFHAAIVEP